MKLYNKVVEKEEKISVVGLGYVGMPIAVAFAKKVDVIGFDLNKNKIDLYHGLSHEIPVGISVVVNAEYFGTSCL